MKTLLLSCLLLFSLHTGLAQLSSLDIRQVSGKGPYPIYLNLQFANAGTKHTFREFIQAYSTQHNVPFRSHLWGFEGNLGIVVNEDNLLGITGLAIHGFSFEFGYRYLDRAFEPPQGGRRLRVVEEVLSARFGWRNNLIYPVTFQLQAGPSLLNYASVRESVNGNSRRIRDGDDTFRKAPRRNRLLPGLEGRARLMLMDPAGTSGGLGFFFETRYLITFGKRDLTIFNELLDDALRVQDKGWDYFSFSLGFVAPLALPIPSD